MTDLSTPAADDTPGLDAKVRFLCTPAAHGGPGAAQGVQALETHMSWVFMVGERVLKLLKPVRFPFLDFSTLAQREHCCREALRLNERLAPGVYLGLVALQWQRGRLWLCEPGHAPPGARTVDWLIVMRRLPEASMLHRRIAQGSVSPAQVDALVAVLAHFYQQARVVPLSPAELSARSQRELAANREVLLRPQFGLPGAAHALNRLDAALHHHAGALRLRCLQGRLVDGHGDLRPEHVCLLDPPVVIDCIEFNPALRVVDPFDEIAFLGFECALAGAGWIGPHLWQGLAAALADDPPAALRCVYTAQRALLRARLAMAHLLDPAPRTPEKWPPLAQHCVQHALAALDELDALGHDARRRHESPPGA